MKKKELLSQMREAQAVMANTNATAEERQAAENKYAAAKREIEMINIEEQSRENKPKQTLVGQLREAIRTNQRSITVAATHDHVIETEMEGLLEPLYAKSVLASLGVRFYKGLPQGDIQVPVMGKGTVGWAEETGAAGASTNTFSHVTLKPHRLTAYVDISKQFLNQDTVGAEEAIRRDLVNALNDKLEATILGNGDGKNEAQKEVSPKGLFNNKTLEDATTFAKLVAAETKTEEANIGGNVKYLLSCGSKADLRVMPTNGNGSKRVMENGDVDGVSAIVTSNVAAGKFIYGDFSQLAIGSWGDIDITIDPYTQAGNGCIRLVVNAYFDAQVLRPEAFVYGRTRAISE